MKVTSTISGVVPKTSRSEAEKKKDRALGKRLAQFRKERGFTQVDLAEKLGCIQPILSDYERGRVRTPPEILIKLCKELNVSADDLLGIKPSKKQQKPPLSRRFLKRLMAVEKLPKRDQETLLRTIDAFLELRKVT